MLALAAFALERARLDSHTIADYNAAGSAKPVDKTLGARLKRALLALKRVGTLAILATPVALAAPVAYATGDILPSLSDMVWEYSLWGIEVAGPTFIKLTQWASTRSDLFPAEFCLRFARLQDATRGHSWDDTAITLRKEFGDDWETRLEIDDSKLPIGSGCIAQVSASEGVKESYESCSSYILHTLYSSSR
jgi:aarF domain-containing kinase